MEDKNNPITPAAAVKPRMTHFRRKAILGQVHREGVARVGDLSQQFDVSEVTIRSDLGALEKAGLLRRDHGGAIAHETSRQVKSLLRLEERAVLRLAEKQRIARAAVALVSPGDSIILDAGTTVMQMSGLLAGVTPLTIVTNALNTAAQISLDNDAQLIFLGGSYHRESSSNVGPLTQHNLDEIRVQTLFLGTQAMDLQHGLTDSTMEIAQVKRAMIRAAKRVILLTDSTKWDRSGFSKVAPLKEVNLLISDTEFPDAARAELEKLGIEVELV